MDMDMDMDMEQAARRNVEEEVAAAVEKAAVEKAKLEAGRRRMDFWVTVSPPVRRRPQAA